MAHNDMFYSGGTLIVDHGHGLSTTYMHLHKLLVEEGQRVKQGDVIAQVGATGRVTGPHLHWGMNWFDTRLDPSLLVPPMPEAMAAAQ
jgi:murein DD-endopeptidase MepM/ murein hydrolase activator NlpD